MLHSQRQLSLVWSAARRATNDQPADILQLLATSAAGSVELFGTGKADLADVLQEFAERTGLVELLGQDVVQQIVSAPFMHLHEARS
jgi:hypothetical protein